MELINTFLYIIIAVVSVAVFFIRNRMLYWKKRGVPHDEPVFFFGNTKALMGANHTFLPIRNLYKKFKGTAPFCGIYIFSRPAALVLELDLVKKILIKDFSNFVDRGMYHNEKDDPLTGHLFALDGNRWRQLRTKLTPTFTSGKMKFMFPTVVNVGHEFVKVLGEMVGTSSVVEVKEVLARFTTDVIGTCAFGIECNSLKDPNAEFRVVGRRFLNEQRHHPIVNAFIRSFPDLARKLGFRIIADNVHNFFMGAVRDTVEYREKNGIVRNDFMNLLIDLKNKKSVETESGELITGLTMEELAAQAFVFYLGGFETSSSTMGYALFELAKNQDIQNRLRNEVNEVLAKHNGVLDYESIKEMPYMDQVIYETLRKYTIVFVLTRMTKEDYPIPETKFKLEKGTMAIIPADAIHHDPELYPDPEVFDPERFTPEAIQKRDPVAWLAFGDGPRNCIGLRFGKMQTRIGLSLLLKNFRFHLSEEMSNELKLDPKGILLQTDGGIFLKTERICL